MPARVIFGVQWGDEGKGKIVDFLAEKADWVVRFQGGSNAGHTVVVGDTQFIFHLIPGGMLHEGKINIVGGGVVIDPEVLLGEMKELEDKGITLGDRLKISCSANVILPYHKALDIAQEEALAGG